MAKSNAVAKDLRTPKYKMRVEPSAFHYERNKVREKKEIEQHLANAADEKYDEYDVD